MARMRYSIRQNGDLWEVLSGDTVIATVDSSAAAMQTITDELAALAALAEPDTQLAAGDDPEGSIPGVRWRSGMNGEALRVETGDGRDFRECEFSHREGPLPLMLQTNTEMGHMGATLAGWSLPEATELRDGVPHSGGCFHDNDAGREAVRILQAQGRFGVSVDPGAAPDIDWVCDETDEDGFCVSETIKFLTYQIAGRTMTPFPGFADAYVELAGAPADSVPTENTDTDTDEDADTDDAGEGEQSIAASGNRNRLGTAHRPEPSAEYARMPEPDDTDPRYVAQRARGVADGEIAIPLTIADPDDDGWSHVYGHFYVNGACHVGYPGECLTAPPSPTDYANFNQFGLRTDDGVVPVGSLVYGIDHAHLGLDGVRARDHYAHTGMSWARVAASNGRHGGWISGVVNHDVSEAALTVLSASGLSGDWRLLVNDLDVYGIQSVNMPGFPVTRQIAASGGIELNDHSLGARRVDGQIVQMHGVGFVQRAETELQSLVASGAVSCPSCLNGNLATRRRRPNTGTLAGRGAPVPDPRLDRIEQLLATVEQRTRHLAAPERERLRAEIAALSA